MPPSSRRSSVDVGNGALLVVERHRHRVGTLGGYLDGDFPAAFSCTWICGQIEVSIKLADPDLSIKKLLDSVGSGAGTILSTDYTCDSEPCQTCSRVGLIVGVWYHQRQPTCPKGMGSCSDAP